MFYELLYRYVLIIIIQSMLYQIGIILIIIVAAIIVSQRFNQKSDLIYEDEMEEDELKKLDDAID